MADAAPEPTGRLVVFGVNHRSATAALREKLCAEDVDQSALLGAVKEFGVRQTLVLATCDRLEVVALHEDPAAVAAPLAQLFAARAQVPPEQLEDQSYCHYDEAALRHLFAVAASLDSQVIGEPQVLGQVKESHRHAASAGTLGPELEAVLQGAYAAAKRVRSETSVAERPVSIAAAALLVGRNLHGDLSRCSALLFGLGEMAELMAMELKDAGLSDLTMMHSSAARAEATAHRLQCHFRPWEELADALVHGDIVVTSLGAGRHCVTATMVEAALKLRRRRPILFLDTAVPCDVEPAVGALDGAFIYDLGDLEGVAREGKETREAASVAAWRVLDDELAAFLRRSAERAAVPAVSTLRRHFEDIREQVLAQNGLDAAAATRLLIKRLLHDPSEVLRAAAADDPQLARSLEDSTGRLFRLGESKSVALDDGAEEDEA